MSRVTDPDLRIPIPPVTSRRTPPDVYAYLNSTRPVRLCLSCAVRRRREGKTVVLVSDKPVSGKCEGCGE